MLHVHITYSMNTMNFNINCNINYRVCKIIPCIKEKNRYSDSYYEILIASLYMI